MRAVELASRVAPWLIAVAALLLLVPMAWLARNVRGRALAKALARISVAAPLVLLGAAWFLPATFQAWTAASDVAPPAMLAIAGLGALAGLTRWPRVAGGSLVASLVRSAALGVERLRRVALVAIGRLSRGAGVIWIGAVMLLSLLRAWSPLRAPSHEWSGVHNFSLMQGRFLTSDALYGWASSQWLRWHGELPYFGARRPLLPTLLACEGALVDGRPQGLAVCNVLLMAASIFLAARAAGRAIGAWTGVATAAILIGYAQHFVALPMSETLGLALGALGMALLVPGVRERRLGATAGGSFGLALGLAARGGVFLVLPAMLLAVAWNERRSARRALAMLSLCAVAMAAAFGVDAAVFTLTTDGSGARNSNFAYVFCGLAGGSTWTDALTLAIDRQPGATEAEHASIAVEEGMRRLREHPEVFVGSLERNLLGFLGAWGPGLSTHFADRLALPPIVAHALWGALGALGVALLVRREPRVGATLALGVLGVLASMPLLWLDGGWRVVAPVMPLLAIAATAFLSPARPLAQGTNPSSPRGPRGRNRTRPEIAPAALLAGLAAILVGTASLAALRRESGERAHIPAQVRMYVQGDGAPPGRIGTIVLPDPATLPAVVIEAHPRFAWFGPARLTPAGFRHELAAWGLSTDVDRLAAGSHGDDAQPRDDAPPGGRLLVQYVRMDADSGMPCGILVASPSFRDRRAERIACGVERLGFSPWLGAIERLVGVKGAEGEDGAARPVGAGNSPAPGG
ncbi:MAG: hypothetical protein U0575_01045 [Phycisphaerales bacterium]